MTDDNDHFDKIIEYKIKQEKRTSSRVEQELVNLLDHGLQVPNARNGNFDDSFDNDVTYDQPQTERIKMDKQEEDQNAQAIKVGMRMSREERKARRKKPTVRTLIEMDHLED